MESNKPLITKPLLASEVVDGTGDMFTKECLQKMAKKAMEDIKNGKSIWATKEFSGQTADIEGYVSKIKMTDEGVEAEVTLLDTPAGQKRLVQFKVCDEVGKKGEVLHEPELAAGGRINKSTTKLISNRVWWKPWTWLRRPSGVRVIEDIDLTSVSFVPFGMKVK